MVFPCGLAAKDSVCNVGDLGSVPGLGRSPGEGQYSGQENSMDSSWTRLSDFHYTSFTQTPLQDDLTLI